MDAAVKSLEPICFIKHFHNFFAKVLFVHDGHPFGLQLAAVFQDLLVRRVCFERTTRPSVLPMFKAKSFKTNIMSGSMSPHSTASLVLISWFCFLLAHNVSCGLHQCSNHKQNCFVALHDLHGISWTRGVGSNLAFDLLSADSFTALLS